MCGVRVEAPADMDPLDIAQAVVGPEYLIKAERLKGSSRVWQDDEAMGQLAKRWEKAYKGQLDKILKLIREYIEKNIILGPLGKAGPKKPLVTPAHVRELQQIIQDYHLAFISGTLGPSTLRPGEVQRLIDAGILPQDLAFTFQPGAHELPPAAMQAIEDAYRYGHVLAAAQNLDEKRLRQKMSYEQFVEEWAPTTTLTPKETQAIEWAKAAAAVHIVGLGNRVAEDFSLIAIEADQDVRRQYMGVIRETVTEGLEQRKAWRKVASELGHKTGDWTRDFGRIAATEKQTAMQEGYVSALIAREGDPDDIMVAKQPNPDACPDCLRLHVNRMGQLRIFKLSDLIANGTNVGVKRRDWRAVVGTVHPWCSCETIHVPRGMGFNEDGDLVPIKLTRADLLERDLRKAMPKDPPKAKHLTYGKTVPEDSVVIRVGDPMMRAAIEKVLAVTPREIFHKKVGVTLITTETPRVQNPLEEHDYAYWTGNEIRIMQTLPVERIPRVLPHEIGHSLNVHLIQKLGSIREVRKWHDSLWAISKDEGFVSDYARRLPIENAAEVSMLYLYHRKRLMLRWPRQFAFAHKWYKDIWHREKKSDRTAEAAASG
jgi:hypothetical protein